jgi:gliding motility-associated-like protein
MPIPRCISLKLVVLVWAISCCSAHAQNEWNTWYFGSLAGLDFNSGEPRLLDDGALSTVEGCASISDKYGNLLFYTDGVKVWDRFHGVMQNGTGLFGNFSTTQCQIIPTPGDSTRYYIFTADFQGNKDGLCYSVVDLKKNNGLGEVVQKNKRLKTPVTEKISAVRHSNGRDFWVVAHEWQTSKFLSYLISPAGISAPVFSDQGAVHANGFQDMNAIGTLKFNLDGSRLAVAIHDDNVIELFHFDNATGAIAHDQSLVLKGGAGPYGLEFSPNGKWLYASLFNANKILQFDLSEPTGADMVNSAYLVGEDMLSRFSALQLAADGRIYVACFEKPYLSVINFPGRKGAACDFELKGLSLIDRNSVAGLPAAITSYFPRFRYKQACLGDTTYFSIPETDGILSVKWDFGDPGSGALNQSMDTATFHIYQLPGTYKVTMVCNTSGKSDTSSTYINVRQAPVFDLGNDTVLCGSEQLILNVFEPGAHYFWQNTSRKPEFTVTEPGKYWVRVYNQCGERTDTIEVRYVTEPEVELGKDSIFCDEINYELKVSWPGATIQWQDGSTDTVFLVTKEGTYYVSISTACGSASDTIGIGKRRCNLRSSLELPNVITPNGDGSNESFLPTSENIDSYEILIYNRWGQPVYSSNDINEGWKGMDHGKELKEGIYYYQLRASGADGVFYDRTGTVTLLR